MKAHMSVVFTVACRGESVFIDTYTFLEEQALVAGHQLLSLHILSSARVTAEHVLLRDYACLLQKLLGSLKRLTS